MIRTQINKDGSTTTWNSEGGIHKGMHVTTITGSASSSHVARLNKLREFNKLSEQDKFMFKANKFDIPLPRGHWFNKTNKAKEPKL